MHAIELKSVSKAYPVKRGLDALFRNPFRRESIQALENVSFHVDPGEIVALLGPNGSGKSTALKILASLILPGEGEALVDGRDTVRDSLYTRSRLGICMAEERSFYYRLTGRQNLRFFGKLRGIDEKTIRQGIDELAELLQIREIDSRFMTYSTGTKQKLSVVRALIGSQPIMILDEPTRGLDPYTCSLFLDRLRHLAHEEGCAILLASHDLGAVDRISDKLVFLHQGHVLAAGTPDEVVEQFEIHLEVCIEVTDPDEGWFEPLRSLPDLENLELIPTGPGIGRCELRFGRPDVSPESLIHALSGRYGTMRRLEIERGSLEEIYKRYSRKVEE